MKVTLKDIAEDTGYSISTVSRALRDDNKISDRSKQKIAQSAQRLKYPLANNAITNGSDVDSPHFAIVSDFREGEFYSSFFSAFNSANLHFDVNFGLYSYANLRDPKHIIERILELEDHGFNGAVIFIPDLKPKHYRTLLEKTSPGFPLISISMVHSPVMDTIAFDAYSGGFSVANHFGERGYKSTGLIFGPHDRPEALLRANGYADYFKQHTDVELDWIYDGDYSIQSGQRAFEAFQKLDNKPRAIFASNDDMAMGFMQSALAAAYRFPDDIAIAGYDDLRICSIVHPTLTSVSTDFEKMAFSVSEQLINRLDNHITHQGFMNLIPIELKVRESS